MSINFYLDDVFITGFCRIAANIRYIQIPGVLSSRHELTVCDRNKVLNVQGISSGQMQHMWKMANNFVKLNNNTDCSYLSHKHLLAATVLLIVCLLGFVRLFKL